MVVVVLVVGLHGVVDGISIYIDLLDEFPLLFALEVLPQVTVALYPCAQLLTWSGHIVS